MFGLFFLLLLLVMVVVEEDHWVEVDSRPRFLTVLCVSID